MSQFNSTTFVFNGISSERFDLMLLDVNEDSLKKKFGLDRTIEEEQNSIGHVPFFVRVKNNAVDITMELVKTSDGMTPSPFTEKEEIEIKRWLFLSSYKPLVVDGLVYYIVFDKVGSKWSNSHNQGYITLNAHVQYGFAHSPIFVLEMNVKGEKIDSIKNVSNVDETTFIDLNITQLSNTKEDIIVENKTNGDKLVFKDIEKGENVVAYSQDMEAYSLSNPSHNIFNEIEYNNHFITARYGKNILKCTGNFQITFTYDLLMQL